MSSVGGVTICVVTRNNATCIERSAESIRSACANVDCEIIFVENASSDGTLALLSFIPDAKIIPLEQNVGFAAGHNLAMQHASSDYLLLLNADAVLDASAVERMIGALEADPLVAAVGPCIVDENNRVLHSVVPEPSLIRELGQSLIRHICPKSTRRLRETVRRRPTYVPTPTAAQVRMVDGVCVMLRKAALDHVGGLDEQFFFDYESIDLGERLTKAGYRIIQQQDASALHIAGGGHSRKLEPDSVVWSTTSGIRMNARRGRPWFVTYLVGTAMLVALRAGFERVAGSIDPAHRATSERYHELLKSLWSMRGFEREWQSHTQVVPLDQPRSGTNA